MSQSEFADEVGISKDEISLLERRKANPTLDLIKAIAAYMGTTVSDLLKVDDDT